MSKLRLTMDSDEHIQAHVLSIWKESKKMFSIHGKEGMLLLTDKHLMFVYKTQAKMKWWQATSQRQILNFLKTKNIMLRQDGYGEEDLRFDLENKKNIEIAFDNILNISCENKTWGGVLSLEFNKDGKNEKYDFSVVRDWVKYPEKTPMKYVEVDWSPLVQYVKDRQKITK